MLDRTARGEVPGVIQRTDRNRAGWVALAMQHYSKALYLTMFLFQNESKSVFRAVESCVDAMRCYHCPVGGG